jgi:hypothetical protein
MGQFYPSGGLSLSSDASNLDVNYISTAEKEISHVIPLVILQTHIQLFTACQYNQLTSGIVVENGARGQAAVELHVIQSFCLWSRQLRE